MIHWCWLIPACSVSLAVGFTLAAVLATGGRSEAEARLARYRVELIGYREQVRRLTGNV